MSTAHVFLSHATDDKHVVEKLARALLSRGIDVFYDSWEIRTGESIRQRIEDGISACTHFAIVLSPTSITRPWVNAELDAGLIRRLDSQCVLLPLRLGLPASAVPPLLRGFRSVALDDLETAVAQLAADIEGVSQKPTLGAPRVEHSQREGASALGLSLAAYRIVGMLCRLSEHGAYRDPCPDNEEIMKGADLTEDDLEAAVDELEGLGLVKPLRVGAGAPLGYVAVAARPQLFAYADQEFMSWVPESDARILAELILASPRGNLDPEAVAGHLGWSPRRMNPACEVLVQQGAADRSNALSHPFNHSWLMKTPRTRRWLAQ
jgi:hypothetical protein